MNRTTLLYIVPAVLALLACSCHRQDAEPVPQTVSFNMSCGFTSKAGAATGGESPESPKLEDDGAAANVNRYIVEVYSKRDTMYYTRVVKTVPAGTLNTTVDIKLVPCQDYFFLFWADCSDAGSDLYYNTLSDGDHGLRKVAFKGQYCGNSDAKDAFCRYQELYIDQDGWKQDVVLKRPFAQVNIITDDYGDVYQEYMKPTKVKLTSSVFTAFDVLRDVPVGGRSELVFESAPYWQLYKGEELKGAREAAGRWTMSMDYIFTGTGVNEVSSPMTLTLTANGSDIVRTIPNVEVRRNWRTNICGTLIVQGGKYDVVVNPFYEGTFEDETFLML